MPTTVSWKGKDFCWRIAEILWNKSLQNISVRYKNKTTSLQLIILCNRIAKWNRCLSISQFGWDESQMPIRQNNYGKHFILKVAKEHLGGLF